MHSKENMFSIFSHGRQTRMFNLLIAKNIFQFMRFYCKSQAMTGYRQTLQKKHNFSFCEIEAIVEEGRKKKTDIAWKPEQWHFKHTEERGVSESH